MEILTLLSVTSNWSLSSENWGPEETSQINGGCIIIHDA